MATPTVDPELQPIWSEALDIGTPSDVNALRAIYTSIFRPETIPPPAAGSIQLPSHTVTSADGTPIQVLHFSLEPSSAASEATTQPPARAVVFTFGGGLVMGDAPSNTTYAGNMAVQTRSQVFVPAYRLAPEHPAPAALEDVYATLRWVQTHAADLGVDPARVVLFGISAGGGITAGVSLMARDRRSSSSSSGSGSSEAELPLPAGVALRYPMLDDRTTGSPDDPTRRYHVWSSLANELAWTAYAGGKTRAERTDENMSVYAAPGRAGLDRLRGLPPTFVDVPELDLFRGEVITFAGALARAGVEVEFHHYLGLPHGVEVMAPGISKVLAMNENLYRFIRRF